MKRAQKDKQCWGAGIPNITDKTMPMPYISIKCKQTNPEMPVPKMGPIEF